MKCSRGEPVRDAQCFNCGEWHDNHGFESWPDMPLDEQPTTTEAHHGLLTTPDGALSGGVTAA